MNTTTLKVRKLHPDAVLPQYQTAGAACFDLVAAGDGEPHPNDQHGWIFPTGLSVEVPPGYVMLIYSRSGHGFKDAMRLSNAVGVIDSDYRGEIRVSLRADGRQPSRQYKGSRIAQAMLVPIPAVQIIETDELSETARGAGGFGSTGS